MLKRRIFLATPVASALLVLCAPVHAQRVADVIAGSFDTLKVPVPPMLDTSKGEKVEIRQFFAYWCPHCANLEPTFVKWEKSVPKSFKLVRTPVAFNDIQKPLAILFYVLDTLPNANDLHTAVFSAIHKTRILSPNIKEDKLREFAINTLKVPKATLDAAWSSFGIQTKLKQGIVALDTYNIESIPAFVVQGKYLTSPARMAQSPAGEGLRGEALFEAMFKAIDNAATLSSNQ